jgi:hypothetical protein
MIDIAIIKLTMGDITSNDARTASPGGYHTQKVNLGRRARVRWLFRTTVSARLSKGKDRQFLRPRAESLQLYAELATDIISQSNLMKIHDSRSPLP